MRNFLQNPRMADGIYRSVRTADNRSSKMYHAKKGGAANAAPFRASNITFSFQNTSIHIKGIFLAVQTLPDTKIQAILIFTDDVHFL